MCVAYVHVFICVYMYVHVHMCDMRVCMCMHEHVCMSAYSHVCMCMCEHVCTSAYSYVRMCMHEHVCTSAYSRMCMCMCEHVCRVHTHMCTCVCMSMCAHAHGGLGQRSQLTTLLHSERSLLITCHNCSVSESITRLGLLLTPPCCQHSGAGVPPIHLLFHTRKEGPSDKWLRQVARGKHRKPLLYWQIGFQFPCPTEAFACELKVPHTLVPHLMSSVCA